MSIRIYNPFIELNRIDNLIKEAFEPYSLSYDGFFAPVTDIQENNEGFEIQVLVPGIKASELNIDATTDNIEIQAETKKSTNAENKETLGESESVSNEPERVSRRYYKKIQFKVPIDPKTGKVTLEDGILTIQIQKRPEAKKISLAIN